MATLDNQNLQAFVVFVLREAICQQETSSTTANDDNVIRLESHTDEPKLVWRR